MNIFANNCFLQSQKKIVPLHFVMMLLLVVLTYFAVLFGISRWSARRATNETFFRGERRSPWWLVAFGMVGASISGVTFVSVPGMVLTSDMAYLQLCLGFVLGYLAVAFVLLPVYYRLNLTSIYSYIGQRLGRRSYQTSAWFFLLSKMTGAALKFYVVCMILSAFLIPDGAYRLALLPSQSGWCCSSGCIRAREASEPLCSLIRFRRSVSSPPFYLLYIR